MRLSKELLKFLGYGNEWVKNNVRNNIKISFQKLPTVEEFWQTLQTEYTSKITSWTVL